MEKKIHKSKRAAFIRTKSNCNSVTPKLGASGLRTCILKRECTLSGVAGYQ